jgi:FkbM family methyltransferase
MFTRDWSGGLSCGLNNLYRESPTKPMTCLEIGSFEGLGTNIIYDRLCKNNGGKVYCVDPWDDEYVKGSTLYTDYLNSIFKNQYERFVHNTRDKPQIIPVRGYSDDVVPKINDTFDFAFIDGDHSPEQVYKDACMTLPKMKPGGIILFDDYDWTDNNRVARCGDGIDKFIQENKDKVQIIYNPGHELAVIVLDNSHKKSIVQIGTNNGNDDVRNFCISVKPDFILLVEPFKIHIDSIKKNYESLINNVVIEDIAIFPDETKETVKLFYTIEDGPKKAPDCSFQVTSVNSTHVIKHYPHLTDLDSFEAKCMTLNKLFDKYNLRKIDYLFLDIEGIDFEVLISIDFDKYDIKHLQIEHLHLDNQKLIEFMTSKGYIRGIAFDSKGFDMMFDKL